MLIFLCLSGLTGGTNQGTSSRCPLVLLSHLVRDDQETGILSPEIPKEGRSRGLPGCFPSCSSIKLLEFHLEHSGLLGANAPVTKESMITGWIQTTSLLGAVVVGASFNLTTTFEICHVGFLLDSEGW